MSRKLMTFEKTMFSSHFRRQHYTPGNQNTFWMYFARLSENFMSVCDKILHFVFNLTGNTSSDFLQKLQMSGKIFSPPEPSRAKFTPSGQVFRLNRPLAWTLDSSVHVIGQFGPYLSFKGYLVHFLLRAVPEKKYGVFDVTYFTPTTHEI